MKRSKEIAGMTPSEVEIVRRLADGHNLTEIAASQGYKNAGVVHTKFYRMRIRVGITNAAEAVAYCFRHNLIK